MKAVLSSEYVWILLVAGAVLFTGLGSAALWDRDEPRNAACAREMLERGDWVVPTFNERLRAHKPVLLYWLMMIAYGLFGPSEFAARFWSAVLGTGTALLTFQLGRLLYRREVGLWAALLLLTCLMFDVSARAATPDATLVFCCTLALYLFACASQVRPEENGPGRSRNSPWTYAGMYAALGLAVLAKGPVGVVLPTAAFVLFRTIMLPRRWPAPEADSLGARLVETARLFSPARVVQAIGSLHLLTGVLVVGAVALPWYVWVGVRTEGAFLVEFLGKHNFSRFAAPMEGHRGPPFYYVIAILVGMFPASIFAGPTVASLIRRLRRQSESVRPDALLCCWIGTFVLVFTLAGTKLPSYVLPAYPALALLIGAYVHGFIAGPSRADRIWFRLAMAALAVVGVGLLVGLPIAASHLLPGEETLGLVGLIPLLAAPICWLLARQRRRLASLVVFAGSAALFATAVFGFAALRVDRHKVSRPLLAKIHESRRGPAPRIAAYRHFRSTYVYYAKQRVDEMVEPEQVREHFLAGGDAYLILPDEHLDELRGALPPGVEEIERRPRFLKRGEVVLLGRRDAPALQTANRPHVLRESPSGTHRPPSGLLEHHRVLMPPIMPRGALPSHPDASRSRRSAAAPLHDSRAIGRE